MILLNTLITLLLVNLLTPLSAQDVRAVDEYIYDPAPVAGIGVGERVPQRIDPSRYSSNQKQSKPEVATRSSSFDHPVLTKETEEAISYVEDVLTGRLDPSTDSHRGISESIGRTSQRPATSVQQNRGASQRVSSGTNRDDTRRVAERPIVDDRRQTVHTERTVEVARPQAVHNNGASQRVSTGTNRDDTRRVAERPIVDDRRQPVHAERTAEVARPQTSGIDRGINRNTAAEHSGDNNRESVTFHDGQRNADEEYRSSGGIRDSPIGTKRDDPIGVTPGRQKVNSPSVQTGNSREYSRDDGQTYNREDLRPATYTTSRDAIVGNAREDQRKHVANPSRDSDAGDDYPVMTSVNDHRGTIPGNARETVVSNSRDTHSGNSRDAIGTNSRGSVASNSRDPYLDDARETVPSNPRDTYTENSRDTISGNTRGNVAINSRDPYVDSSRDTILSDHRDTVEDNPRDTYTGNSRDTVSGNSWGNVASNSRDTYVDSPRETISSNSRDTFKGDSSDSYAGDSIDTDSEDYGETYPGESRDSYFGDTSGTLRGLEDKIHRDVAQARFPHVEHLDEGTLYTSQRGGSIEPIEDHESEDEFSGAYSSRPMPKTQKPRQVTAVAQPRAARGPHPASPCPSVFSYEGTRAGKERWYGVVLITTDETLTGVRLDIQLDKAADLLGTWLGEVSSVDNIRYTIWNGRRKIQPGPPLSLKLFVKYSDKELNPPRVRSIRLNGRQICPKDQGSVPIPVPKPKPPRNPPARPSQPAHRPNKPATSAVQNPNRPTNSGVQNQNRPAGNGRPTSSVPAQKPPQTNLGDQSSEATELVDGVACGRIEVQASPLITYGQRTARGQWPWHAAIYQSKGTDLSFICGGSLIGKRTIVTAAHCVSRRYIDRPVDPESLVVYLGKYHLKLWSEGGVQDKQVLEVHVHPEYNSTDFQADIAILVLSSPVEFTVYVKPVCLWDRNRVALSEIEGREGVVVGWGYDERGIVTEELMMAKMPVVSQQTCIWSYPQFFSHFTSDRTYCAGFRNGTSVCNGDSGGGMVFPKAMGNGVSKPHTWVLRGIVSLSASQAERRVCNTDHYVVFTDVVKFIDWIKKYQ